MAYSTVERAAAVAWCLRLRRSALVGALFLAPAAQAQTRWKVDAASSLAWWQVNPNLNHLWATTCPGEPSWRPGEGRSSGWSINVRDRNNNFGNDLDSLGSNRVPLYPRHRVRHLCVEAVRGDVAADTIHWRSARGTIAVRSDALVTGEAMRDNIMHRVLGPAPEILFRLDSAIDMVRHGDTLTGSAVGVLTVRGIDRPITAMVKAFPDSGNLRVLAKWRLPAKDLEVLTPNITLMSLGVATGIWKDLYMGVDLVLRPAGLTPTSSRRVTLPVSTAFVGQ